MKPNDDEFFKKYGFTLTMSKPHPIYKDTMTFTGLEADHVSSLERDVDHLEKIIERLRSQVDHLVYRESSRLREENLKKDFK